MPDDPQTQPDLPTTVEASIDASQLDDLFRDLSACATIEHVTVKTVAQADPTANASLLENPDLVQARWLLDQDTTRAVQVRYRFDGTLWIDTLTRRGDRHHLLRVQHA